MKKLLLILYVIDIIAIIVLSAILIWWKRTHTVPGLSEMLNFKLFVIYLIAALLAFLNEQLVEIHTDGLQYNLNMLGGVNSGISNTGGSHFGCVLRSVSG